MFPNNMYYSKKTGKSLQPKPNRKASKGQQNYERRSPGEKTEGPDVKRTVNFECFICGFKIDLDKGKA